MKIDVNKSGRIFDFLVSAGMLHLAYDPSVKGLGPGKEGHVIGLSMEMGHHRPTTVDIYPDTGGRLINGGHGG